MFNHCKQGLDILSGLLRKEKATQFQTDVVEALMLYSRSSTSKTTSDKLVYILTAIESLFLRNKSEHIQTNIGERMGFFAGATAKERIAIKDNVIEIYEIRSNFLHHGATVSTDDFDKLRVFMVNSWRCLGGLARLAVDDNMSRDRFFEMLNERKWA